MTYVILATGVLTLIVLIAVLVKVSGKKDSPDYSSLLNALQEQLRRIEQNQAVLNAKIEALDSHSANLNRLVDSRMASFSDSNEKLT